MKGLCRIHSHEDEPAWGHLIRAELTGGSRSICNLELTESRVEGSRRTQILAFLSSCDGISVRDYVARHGEGSLIRSIARSKTRKRNLTNGLPLTAGGHGARRNFPPKACQQCVREDVAQHGYAWFKRRHNLAGVASCYHHGSRLFIAGTAGERSNFRVSLAQLESRAQNPLGFAYADDFVRRYEMALLMLVQRRRSPQTRRVLTTLIKDQMRATRIPASPVELIDLVRGRSNTAWLQQTFLQEGGKQQIALGSSLAEIFDRPTYAYYMALTLAAVFTDLAELSVVLRAHNCGNRIKPLLRAAGCSLRRTSKRA